MKQNHANRPKTRGPYRRRPISMRHTMLVEEYFKNGFNKTAAAKHMGYLSADGYIKRLFENPNVAEAIERKRAAIMEKYEVTEEWVMERLKYLAGANTGDILLKLEQGEWDLSCLTSEERFAISKFQEEVFYEGRGENKKAITKRKIEVADSMPALVAIMRKLGMFNDKVHLTGEISLVDRIQAGLKQAQKPEEETD